MEETMWRKVFVTFAVGAALALPAAAQDTPATIADAVVAAASAQDAEFTVLLAAVQAADPSILALLSNPEAQMTVFAPTDAAFVALLEELGLSAEELLANTELVNAVLAYHVVPDLALTAEQVVASATTITDLGIANATAPTANGQYLDIFITEEGGVMVDKANVVATDIITGNGIIHVIDAVLLPEDKNLAEIVVAATEAETPEFTVLLAAVSAAGLVDAISGTDTLTVFAPTDEAFAAALEALGLTAEQLLADTDTLTAVLLYHVVAGRVGSNDLSLALGGTMEGMEEVPAWYGGLEGTTLLVNTLGGSQLAFTFDLENGPFINDSKIVASDIDATNGIIHVIDAVLLPE
jgi:uncharacterized surface protein with fasciclin (FAS1) repeats